MQRSSIRYSTFPRTEPPPHFADQIVAVFKKHEATIATELLQKGLTNDAVLRVLCGDLEDMGFEVESGKRRQQKIERPVFFGENGAPRLNYQVDAYHDRWNVGMEVEAGRAWMGNAVYRDLIQAAVMVGVDTLVLAVPNIYRYQTSGRSTASNDYSNTLDVADALFGHSRLRLPYRLVVIGY